MSHGSDASPTEEMLAQARQVQRLLRVEPGVVDLHRIDPQHTPGLPSTRTPGLGPKAWSRAEVARLGVVLADLQERVYAAARVAGDRTRLLLVLQGMDCAGKDGTVKSVIGSMNPLGVRITAFGTPTPAELSHHFLRRVYQALPGRGYVGVFNRSHYEDVLAARVRSMVPRAVWSRRYDEINHFEADQVADGMTVVKVMLHISAAEQRQRLLARLAEPTKRWKFHPGDVDDRLLWSDYQDAYAEALARCGTAVAPWYVVPADRKWYRNWAVANLLLVHLHDIAPPTPAVDFDIDEQVRRLGSDSGGP